ncbi:MAG: hypothetical protein ACPGUE_21280 [Marinomonas sp.]
MPTYESKCHVCGKEYDYIRTIAKYKDTPDCCGQPTVKEQRTAPAPPQFDTLDFRLSSGEYVRTKKERKEVMKRNGYVRAQDVKDWKPKHVPELSTREIKEVRDQVLATQ